jgi:hypothetical protein
MLTLQTCTPIPTCQKRLIVRADRLYLTASHSTTLSQATREGQRGVGGSRKQGGRFAARTPHRKICVYVHRYKHTSLDFIVVTFYELRLDPNSTKFAV